MADDTDFIDLYVRLCIEPGCTLAEFKQAYRRHVAQWHPDRRPSGRADALAARRLQRLTAQYGAAMDFHRRHGRLPGAPMPARINPVVTPASATAFAEPATPEGVVAADVLADVLAQSEADTSLTQPEAETQATVEAGAAEPLSVHRQAGFGYSHAAPSAAAVAEPPSKTLVTRWRLVAGLVVVAVLAWSLLPAEKQPDSDEAKAIAKDAQVAASTATPARPSIIALGMSEDQVARIEGEPNQRGSDQWEYGPSWVRFDHGAVSDWYSSPLRGLHVPEPRPAR